MKIGSTWRIAHPAPSTAAIPLWALGPGPAALGPAADPDFGAWTLIAGAVLAFGLVAGWVLGRARRASDEVDALDRRLALVRGDAEDVLLLLSPEGTVVEASARAAEMYGYSGEDLRGLDARALRTAESAGALEAQLRSVLEGTALRYDVMHRRRDGTAFRAEVTAFPLRIAGRAFVQAIIRDVTDERAARAASGYGAMLLDHLHDAVVATDAARRITVWNRAAEALYGWPRANVIGRPIAEVLAIEPRGAGGTSFDALMSSLEQRGRLRVEDRHRTRTGQGVDVETAAVALRDARGALRGFVAVIRDISDRKRIASALRARRARLERILDTCDDGDPVEDAERPAELAPPAIRSPAPTGSGRR